MVRLVNHDKILLSYQLPLLQILIDGLTSIWNSTLLERIFMACIGSLSGVGFYLLAEDLSSAEAAFFPALLFTLHPFIVGISIVPYQEPLMMAGLFFAFHFFFRQKWHWAGLCLGLACLTRF